MIRTILGPFMPAFVAMVGATWASASAGAQSISVDQARTIAKEAYIYGFPLVDSYRIQYSLSGAPLSATSRDIEWHLDIP